MTHATRQKPLIKSAYGVLVHFKKVLSALEPGYQLSEDAEQAMVRDALSHHAQHLAIHNIQQKAIDPFKLLCWFAGSLLEREKSDPKNCGIIMDAAILILRSFLNFESRGSLSFCPESRKLVKSFVLQEHFGDPKHGVWMNGLYLAFHLSITTWDAGQKKTPAM